jgi:hypothetical protein
MADEARPGIWHVSWGDGPPKVLDQDDALIATVAGDHDQGALTRAGLIAAAPELYDTVRVTLMVFRVMAEHGDENTALAASDMIPTLESALDGASFLGEITPEVLSAP